MENLITKKKGESAIVTLTRKRIKNNLNMFCMFTGKLGSGKTWSAISYAQELDPKFDVDNQITFDFRQTMKLINEDWFKAIKIKVIVWDEPQITISNRNWQSQMNKLVNYLVSTFRHQNIVLILAAPYKDFLDTQTMKLLQWEFQCSSIDRKTNRCIVYPKWQQYNPVKKKTYPHPLFVLIDGRPVQVSNWAIKKIDKESIKIYEKNKTNFTDGLNKSIQDTLDELDRQEKAPRDNEDKPKKPLTELQQQILECWKKGMKQKDIVELLGKKQKIISESEGYMRNKGYSRENYQNNLISPTN